MNSIIDIVKSIVFTEKSESLKEFNKHIFVVDKTATKPFIKKSIELMFDTKIAKINIIKVNKKPKKIGKYSGFTKGYKKAIVTLKKGYSLGIEEEEQKK